LSTEDPDDRNKHRVWDEERSRVTFGQPASAGFETGASRLDLVEEAKAAWKGQLVDLGGRNTLLYYRDLKVGTLDLSPGSGADEVQVGELLASRTVPLSHMFDDESRPDAAKRARTVRGKAAENFEERGLHTLFLAWGMATWSSRRSPVTPEAPVLLRQAHLAAKGRADESFEISLPGDWELNPTLLYALRADFGVNVNPDELLALLDEGGVGAPDPGSLFERLTKLAEPVPQFLIAPRVVIGNFSYAKMTMVADLENGTEALLASEIVCAIAGYEPAQQALRDRHPTVAVNEPDLAPPADEFLVKDADASQSYAINAAIRGGDLVIEGPPGTGKSQTIANLIAAFAARGQRVLFVAEKRAAIDAVLVRLAEVGLSDIVLDLHDGVTSKRRLAQDLARSLAGASSIALPEVRGLQETLVRRRGDVVAHDAAMHDVRQPWDISVYKILCLRAGIPETARSPIRVDLEVLTARAYEQAQSDLRAYTNLGGLRLSPATSPWAAALYAGTVPTAALAEAASNAALDLVSHTWPQAIARLENVARECGLQLPAELGGWAGVFELLSSVTDTGSVFEETIFNLPLAELLMAMAPAKRSPLGRSLAAVTKASYRAARRQLRAVAQPGTTAGSRALLAALSRATALSVSWCQLRTDEGQPRMPSDLAGAKGAYHQLLDELRALAVYAGLTDLEQQSAEGLTKRLSALASDTETLSKLPELSRLRSSLRRTRLDQLLDDLSARNLDVDQALATLAWVWLTSLLTRIQLSDLRVGGFERTAHDRNVREFSAADRAHIASGPLRVRRAVAERITAARDQYPEQSQVVAKQAALTRRHLPMRDLYQVAPNVLAALKPCWAMSPLVVSQLLPMQRCFDVVIFDEASQVTPADAVGSLARAERAVVAGDPHQLPPTKFFSASGGGADDENEPDITGALVRDVESVLEQMTVLLPPPIGTRTLRWHYRSKDERLIAFSNAQESLYNYSLTTFPGGASEDTIAHVHVPFRLGRVDQEDSVADEVLRVVALVAQHARQRPRESLGVIAMGVKHSNRVEEAVRRARQTDDALDAFVTGHASDQAHKEPFFVKNLERVQGDERDAIILTVGYGKSSDGRMLYWFGPINYAGGERRLNVAITRARARMTVVSSFSSADLDPKALKAEGAKMLARYLAYAESGGSNLGDAAMPKPDLNPFERDVEAQLTRAGLPLVAQWGSSGYWIDFAAMHPTEPGRMVLAIECDGASYHSSATARDRDRLRQEHLERLGWRFHRIWSAEWFRHRDAEVVRAVDAYRSAVIDAERADMSDLVGTPLPPESEAAVAREPTPVQRRGPMPVRPNLGPIGSYSHVDLVLLTRWIESDSLLRTEDQLLDEAVRLLGYQRRGSGIVSALEAAIQEVRRPR
jgi:very-short-patch-repair endonuclease